MKSVVIPDSVTSIGVRAFFNTSLESVTIGSSVTSIDEEAFKVTNIKEVIFPNSNVDIHPEAFDDSTTIIQEGSGTGSDGGDPFGRPVIHPNNSFNILGAVTQMGKLPRWETWWWCMWGMNCGASRP